MNFTESREQHGVKQRQLQSQATWGWTKATASKAILSLAPPLTVFTPSKNHHGLGRPPEYSNFEILCNYEYNYHYIIHMG